jgi:hypothetical protein
MALVEARSSAEVLDALGDERRPVIVGFFGSFSESARRARLELEHACAAHEGCAAFAVDVGEVRDLHGLFGVDAATRTRPGAWWRAAGGRACRNCTSTASG